MREHIAISRFMRESKSAKPEGFEEAYPTEDALLDAIAKGYPNHIQGYRDGVILVPIPPRFMRTKVVPMEFVREFRTTFESRVPGEPPRKKTVALVDDLPLARSASAVLYRGDVLQEDNDRSSDKFWEVITILAHAGTEPEPMTVGTLLANHFHEEGDGGTRTNMDAKQFEEAIGKAYRFWKAYCMAEVR